MASGLAEEHEALSHSDSGPATVASPRRDYAAHRSGGEIPSGSRRGRFSSRRLRPALLVFALVCVLLIYLVALPLGGILWQSVRAPAGGLSLQSYVDFAQNNRLLTATLNTLAVSLGTGLGSVLIATPLAFGVARTNMRGKGIVRVAVIISFASPPFLMTLAYILVAGPNVGYANQLIRAMFDLSTNVGPLNIFSIWGFLFLALPQTVAFVFITMLPGFGNMDPALEEASRLAGAGPTETVMRISLPVMRAGMLAGGLLAFSTALAMFATPHILGIDVLTVSMRRSILVGADFGEASTIAAVSAALSMTVLFLYRRSIRAGLRFQTITGRGFRPAPLDLGLGRHVLTGIGWTYAILGALLPYVLLVMISFMEVPHRGPSLDNLTLENYQFILRSPAIRAALLNSLVLGLGAASAIAVLGFLLAYVVTRTSIPGRAVADYLTALPLGIAGTAFAIGVIVINLQTPARAIGLYASIWILLVAYVGRYVPWGMRTAQVSLLQVSRELEEASRVGGGSELRTLWHITLPLVKPGVAYAWILGLIQAFTEVSASVILSGAHTEVAATALLGLWQGIDGLQRACALGVLMFVITMTLVVVAQRAGGRGIVPDPGASDRVTPVPST